MVNRAKSKGTGGETASVQYMRSRGWLYATRIPSRGARDEGDMILDQAVPVMVEVKTVKAFTPSTFIAEVEAQIINAAAEFGFAIVKKRGTADVGKYYALTNVDQMMSLIERVYHPSTPQQAVLCNVYDEYGQCDLTRSHAGNHRDAHEPRAFRPEPKRFTRV